MEMQDRKCQFAAGLDPVVVARGQRKVPKKSWHKKSGAGEKFSSLSNHRRNAKMSWIARKEGEENLAVSANSAAGRERGCRVFFLKFGPKRKTATSYPV
jgi:hypothetical protein